MANPELPQFVSVFIVEIIACAAKILQETTCDRLGFSWPLSQQPKRALPLSANEHERVLRDHQFLVRGDDPDRYAAVRSGNARPARLIRVLVQFHAEPRERAAERCAERRGVLADAAASTSASRWGAYELHIGRLLIATCMSNTVASADTGSVGRSMSEAGRVAKRRGPDAPAGPWCPKCGAQIVDRIAEQGRFVGKHCWGCGQCPKYRGVLPGW